MSSIPQSVVVVCKSKSCEVSERIALRIYLKMLLKFLNVILEDGLYVEKKLWKSYQKSEALLQVEEKQQGVVLRMLVYSYA